VPYKSVLQGCPARVSCKNVPQECPTRVSYKSVPQECPTRVSHKSVLQECPRSARPLDEKSCMKCLCVCSGNPHSFSHVRLQPFWERRCPHPCCGGDLSVVEVKREQKTVLWCVQALGRPQSIVGCEKVCQQTEYRRAFWLVRKSVPRARASDRPGHVRWICGGRWCSPRRAGAPGGARRRMRGARRCCLEVVGGSEQRPRLAPGADGSGGVSARTAGTVVFSTEDPRGGRGAERAGWA